MKANIITLILIMFLLKPEVQAQSFCATEQLGTNKNQQLIVPVSPNTKALTTQNTNAYCLRIYVHIIRQSNGIGGISGSDLAVALNLLNVSFNPHKISFDWDNEIDYIDDDPTYFNARVARPNPSIFSVNNHTDGIDLYFFDEDSYPGGLANGIGGSSELYVSGKYDIFPNDPYYASHVISHEMGHVLNLFHTHTTISCIEHTDGSNSMTCGDFVEDTPADPNLRFYLDDSNCQYTGIVLDPLGLPYDPDETLIMSYTNPYCMTRFTQGQGERMRNSIAALPHLIQSIVDCSNACSPNLIIEHDVTTGNTDYLHARDTLVAINKVTVGAGVTYKSGDCILLQHGFDAGNGATFSATIEPCVEDPTLAEAKTVILDYLNDSIHTQINELEGGQQTMQITPNPARNIAYISLPEKRTIERLQIIDMNGRLVFNYYNLEKSRKVNISLANQLPGLYIVKAGDVDGKIYTEKLSVLQ